ncbi:MAG: DNA recombination protein RmuC [Acidobacteriota bacterium]|nr:DNA recombination protein RmuC [Acidobacteriota bacterium]
MEFVSIFFALVAGLAAGWFLAQKDVSRMREKLAGAEAQAAEREKSATNEKEFHSQSLKAMKAEFETLATAALKGNRDEFLRDTEGKVKPLKDALKKLDDETKAMEQKRAEAYGSLSAQITGLVTASDGIRKSSEQMQTLLKGSNQVRGNWGELLLRNVVEFSGMEEHVHFEEQPTSGDGKQRPDMIIRLPGGAGIPVDSKCPFSAFQQAKEEAEVSRQRELMEEHELAVRTHVNALNRKDYSEAVDGDIDFTVMFMPGDHLLEAALAINPKLQEDALSKRILITNPVTLVALLRTVRIYWRQEDLDRNTKQLTAISLEFYDRAAKWMEDVTRLGKHLGIAIDTYNESVGSYETRLRVSADKLNQHVETDTKKRVLAEKSTTPAFIEKSVRVLQDE